MEKVTPEQAAKILLKIPVYKVSPEKAVRISRLTPNYIETVNYTADFMEAVERVTIEDYYDGKTCNSKGNPYAYPYGPRTRVRDERAAIYMAGYINGVRAERAKRRGKKE